MYLVKKYSLFRFFIRGNNSKSTYNVISITVRDDKNTNYARTQCVFQGVSSIAYAGGRRKEKGKDEGTRALLSEAQQVCVFYCVGVYVGCVGRGGSASAGA